MKIPVKVYALLIISRNEMFNLGYNIIQRNYESYKSKLYLNQRCLCKTINIFIAFDAGYRL